MTAHPPHSPEVRLATQDDAQALLETLYFGYLDDRVGLGLKPDPKMMRPFIELILTPGRGFVGIIEDATGEIAASIGIVVDRHWYSSEWVMMEKWVYVAPECRGGGHIDRLFDFLHTVKRETGLPLITSLMTKERLAAKERLWGKHGAKIGAIFLLNGDAS